MHIDNQAIRILTLFVMTFFAFDLCAKDEVKLDLSSAERTWLAEHKVIRLASDINWPPFEWINDDMEHQGIAADYMSLIEKKLGIRFEVEKNKSWPEVVTAVKEHKLDVFSCIAKNPQREEFVNFTSPYLSFPMVIIAPDDISYIDGIEGLKDMVVSVVKGYATHEYLIAHHPDIKLHIVNTSEEGLEAVSQGKVDVFVDNIASATHTIQKRGLTNLKISGEMPIRYELAMAVRDDWPELVTILQKALDSISSEQRKGIYNKWIAVRYEQEIDYSLFWKSLIVFSLIVGVLYYFNLKLSREVSQRKLAQQAAMMAKNEADKANQAKSEFLSVMSHELRTPLTSIKGVLGLLSGGLVAGLPEKAREMITIADNNCDRLTNLINDILDIEKLLAGKMEFNNKEISIEELVNKAAVLNQGYADQYKVSLDIKSNQCGGLTIFADERRLMQVLSNFISNAIKYSHQGDGVLISSQCENYKVRISVTDHGKGIPEDFKDQIFMHFSQADSSDTREKGGTGLGLAISKEIIDRQGGSIGYVSESGKGSTFYFELGISDYKK